MGKYERKRKRAPAGRIILIVLLVLVLAALALFAVPQLLYHLRGEDTGETGGVAMGTTESGLAASTDVTDGVDASTGDTQAEPPVAVTDWVSFPLELEDGLRIDSMIQFDGINPDCGNENASNAAAIVLTNVSATHLSRAEITVVTDDGKLLRFVISELPAGKSVMAFATDNAALSKDAACGNVTCEAEFDPDASMREEDVAVSVTGTHITLENKSGGELTNLVVYCHCTLGDQYFGGITYTYTVNHLAAGETAELDAVDCILGLAEVVRITANEP